MSDKNQPLVQGDKNTKELLAKEALIIKDLQKKLYILKNALIEEKKKTSSLEQLSNEMKSQIKQLEEEIINKDQEIIKLNKEIMDFQNSISLGISSLSDEAKLFVLFITSSIIFVFFFSFISSSSNLLFPKLILF